MKAYGVKRNDTGCCYGHDKFGAKNKDRDHALSTSAQNADRVRKKSARQADKRLIRQECESLCT